MKETIKGVVQVAREKMNDVARETASVAKEKAGDAEKYLNRVADRFKINTEIAVKEANLTNIYAEYGKACFYGNEDEKEMTEDALVEELACIDKLYEELGELTRKKETADSKSGSIYCTNCGAEHSLVENFCSKCGCELKK